MHAPEAGLSPCAHCFCWSTCCTFKLQKTGLGYHDLAHFHGTQGREDKLGAAEPFAVHLRLNPCNHQHLGIACLGLGAVVQISQNIKRSDAMGAGSAKQQAAVQLLPLPACHFYVSAASCTLTCVHHCSGQLLCESQPTRKFCKFVFRHSAASPVLSKKATKCFSRLSPVSSCACHPRSSSWLLSCDALAAVAR